MPKRSLVAWYSNEIHDVKYTEDIENTFGSGPAYNGSKIYVKNVLVSTK